jgi:hypothetical protein
MEIREYAAWPAPARVLGGVLTARLQQMSWERQAQLALFEKRYDEGVKFFDELSNLEGDIFCCRDMFGPYEIAKATICRERRRNISPV